jgi:hypothetical protein
MPEEDHRKYQKIPYQVLISISQVRKELINKVQVERMKIKYAGE